MARSQAPGWLDDPKTAADYPFPRKCRAYRKRLTSIASTAVPLSRAHIDALLKHGNQASDWNQVRVLPGFTPSFIKNNVFSGECIIGRLTGIPVELQPGTFLPSGIYNSMLSDAIIEDESLVNQCPAVVRYAIGAGSVASGSTLIFSGESSSGNGEMIPVGIETGGRELPVIADLSLAMAIEIGRIPAKGPARDRLSEFARAYAAACLMPFGVVEAGSRVISCALVSDSWIGPSVRAAGAQIYGSTVLGTDESTIGDDSSDADPPAEESRVETGAIVRSSVLQPGSVASTHSIVDRSVLMEHSHAERHAKITDSVIGPNSGIAEGEVTAALVGPSVGFHHQALLIAAYWPEGRGNVGHGANIGSNHTSRMPDQEVWPGEGVFFGLGCNVKFPVNLRESPYTVISTGVTLLPQKIRFPFSLLAEPLSMPEGVPSGYLQLIPAWGLSHNIYAIRRNERKFRDRDRARRNSIDFRVFRPEIVGMMRDARGRLSGVTAEKEFYLPEDIPGLGKCFVLAADRKRAISAYEFYLEFAALEDVLLSGTPSDAEIRRYAEMARAVADDVESTRMKDERRGPHIIDDYGEHHDAASADPFVLATREWARQAEERAASRPATPQRR